MIEFLQWLEDNHWHRYKDGTYYSTSPDYYVHGTQRKFYTKKKLIENFILWQLSKKQNS
jgi:hypothetical protein